MEETIVWKDYEKIDRRVVTIIEVKDFLKAPNPAYWVKIDFGNGIGIKKYSAQITTLYKKEDLFGKQVIAVVNFPKKQITNFMGECLILGAVEGKEVVLIKPDSAIPNGLIIS